MTDEIKNEVKCDCKEKAIAKIKEFLFIAGAVFVGCTLSIVVSANILKPKCPMGLMGPRPGIHRQLPPPMMMHRDFDKGMVRGYKGEHHYRKFKKHHRHGEYKGDKGEFKGQRGPQKWDKKPVEPTEKK